MLKKASRLRHKILMRDYSFLSPVLRRYIRRFGPALPSLDTTCPPSTTHDTSTPRVPPEQNRPSMAGNKEGGPLPPQDTPASELLKLPTRCVPNLGKLVEVVQGFVGANGAFEIEVCAWLGPSYILSVS